MLNKLRPRSAYDVIALLALFVAMGGTAYAVNTIGSADIIDESILSADVKNGEVKNADVASSAITSAKIYNGSVVNSELGLNAVTGGKVLNDALTGDDVNESSLAKVPDADKLDGFSEGEFVHGFGQVKWWRKVLLPGHLGSEGIIDMGELGAVFARCTATEARLFWKNTTWDNIDVWTSRYNAVRDGVGIRGEVLGRDATRDIAIDQTATDHWDGSTIALGQGDGPIRIATVHGYAFQSGDDQPCGFQAQAFVSR